jgi:hypothetical protein
VKHKLYAQYISSTNLTVFKAIQKLLKTFTGNFMLGEEPSYFYTLIQEKAIEKPPIILNCCAIVRIREKQKQIIFLSLCLLITI